MKNNMNTSFTIRNMASSTIRKMTYTALLTSVMCVTAPFSVSIGPIPLSFATFIIYLAAGSLGWKWGTLSVALYVIIGAVGLPVFTGFTGGFHRIAGLTGWFIIGYIPCAIVTGAAGGRMAVSQRDGSTTPGYRRKQIRGSRNVGGTFLNPIIRFAPGMMIGTVLLYFCGTVWYIFQTGSTIATALLLCVVPFLPGDAVKIVLACAVTPKLRGALKL